VQRAQIPRLRDRWYRDRRQIGDQLRILRPDGIDHHRIGRPDQRAPALFFPEPEIFSGDQLVPDNPTGHGPEAGGIACVDELLWGRRVEVRRRLRTQDEDPVTLAGNAERPAELARHRDGVVRTHGKALTAADARLVHDLNERLELRADHRNCIGGADAHASQTRHAAVRVDREIHARELPTGVRLIRRVPIYGTGFTTVNG
jgi:hypothetical protein